MERDTKRPTIISIQLSKNEKHIIITDLLGEQCIVDKNDKDGLFEAISEIVFNQKLPEFNLSHIIVGDNELKGKTTAKEGLDLQDLLSNPDKLKSAGLKMGLDFLQRASNYQR
jgi:hypothetical protein